MERDGQNGNREEIRKDRVIEGEGEIKSERKRRRAGQEAIDRERE